MISFSIHQLQSWDRFVRANFVNSLSGFKSATLIGTINNHGNPNLAIFSNIVHIGADPALIGFVNRPKEAAPHSIANIQATGVYTMNHVHTSFIQKAHQTSAKYTSLENEFEKVGLAIDWKENEKAPFVAASKIKYSMALVEIIPIKHNGSFLVIGALQNIYFDENIMDKDGFLSLEKNGTVCSLGIDGYYETNLLARFPYAKPASTTVI